MEFIFTEGCTVAGLSIDGKDINDYSDDEKREIMHGVIDKVSPDLIGTLLMEWLSHEGEYKYLYTCDTCGDSVVEYRKEV